MDYEKFYKENIEYRNSPEYQNYALAIRDFYHPIDETRFKRNYQKENNVLEIIQLDNNKVVLSIELPKIINLYKIKFTNEKEIYQNMNIIKDLMYQYKILGKHNNKEDKNIEEYSEQIKLGYDDYYRIKDFFSKSTMFFNSIENERNEYYKEMNIYYNERKKYFDQVKVNISNDKRQRLFQLFKTEGVPTKKERFTALESELQIKKEIIEAYLKWCQSSVKFIENQRKYNELNKKLKKDREQQNIILNNFIIKEAKVNRLLDSFYTDISTSKKTKISKSIKDKIKQNSVTQKKIKIIRKKKNI